MQGGYVYIAELNGWLACGGSALLIALSSLLFCLSSCFSLLRFVACFELREFEASVTFLREMSRREWDILSSKSKLQGMTVTPTMEPAVFHVHKDAPFCALRAIRVSELSWILPMLM